jgi:maleate cis-trans isomerase
MSNTFLNTIARGRRAEILFSLIQSIDPTVEHTLRCRGSEVYLGSTFLTVRDDGTLGVAAYDTSRVTPGKPVNLAEITLYTGTFKTVTEAIVAFLTAGRVAEIERRTREAIDGASVATMVQLLPVTDAERAVAHVATEGMTL